MHETLHEDPTDVSRRKPRRLRGTPANKYSHLISLGIVGLFSFWCHSYSSADWNKEKKERWVESVQPSEEEHLRKLMMQDVFWCSAIQNYKKKQEGLPLRDAIAEGKPI